MSTAIYGMYISGTSALAYEAPTLRLVPGKLHTRTVAQTAESNTEQGSVHALRIDRRQGHCTQTFGMTLAIIAIALCLMATWLISAHATDAYVAERIAALPETTEVVRAGEGLQTIAAAHPIEGLSVEQTAKWISQRNNLSTSMLHIGQELVVPGV